MCYNNIIDKNNHRYKGVIMKDAVKKDMSVRQINFYSEAYKTDAEMQNDRDITLALAEKRPDLYRYASDRVKADKEVAKTCFGQDGSLIRFAPESVRADPEVALVAVADYPLGYRYLEGEAAKNREVAKVVAASGGASLELLPEEYFSDKEIAYIAVTKNPKNIRFFSDEVRADEKVCLAALGGDRTSYVYFSDDAFLSDKVFDKSVKEERGMIVPNSLSNDMPAGLFDRIAEKGFKIRLSSQKIDLLTIDYDKLYSVLEICDGNIIRKKELLLRIIDKDDRKCAELLCKKFTVPQQIVKELLPYAVQNKKMRVLPYLMAYMNSRPSGKREEREKIIRGLKRNSPKAIQTLFSSISEYADDREVIALCAKTDGSVLKYIQDSPLFSDPEIVSDCVKSYIVKNADKPFVLWFDKSPFSYEDLKILCRKDFRNYFTLDEKLRKDPILCREAVRSGIGVYDKLDEEMKAVPMVREARR